MKDKHFDIDWFLKMFIIIIFLLFNFRLEKIKEGTTLY